MLYTVTNMNQIDDLWLFCQSRDIPMYKGRLTLHRAAWIIGPILEQDSTRLLLEFSNSVDAISGTYYIDFVERSHRSRSGATV